MCQPLCCKKLTKLLLYLCKGKSEIMNNLKEIRTRSGLSQRELANKTKISRSLIAQLELGTAKMTYRVAIILANFFHCYPNEILGEDLIAIHGGFEESIRALCDSNAVDMIQKLQSGNFDKREQMLYNAILGLLNLDDDNLMKAVLVIDNIDKSNKGGN